MKHHVLYPIVNQVYYIDNSLLPKVVYILLLLICFSYNSSAQSLQWQKSIPSKGGYPQPMIATNDGGYLIASSDSSSIQFNKFDKDGKQALMKTLSSNGKMVTLVTTNDGGYLVGGNWDGDYWVMKIDKDWKNAWERKFGGDSTEKLTSLIVNQDGSFLLGGTSYSNRSYDKTQNLKGISDYWVVKIDGNGEKLWDHSYGGITKIAVDLNEDLGNDTIPTGESYLNSIIKTSDGGYLLGGNSSSFTGSDNTSGLSDNSDYPEWPGWYKWIIKVDKNGNKVWDNTYGATSYNPSMKTMVATLDGGFLISSTIFYDFGFTSYGNYFIVHKVNSAGEEEWLKSYGSDGLDGEDLTSLSTTKDGGFLIGGSSSNGNFGNPDKSEDSRGGDDYWIFKVDRNGFKVWDKTIGGNDQDYLTSLFTTSDGNYLLGGISNSGISGDKIVDLEGTNDFWIVKVKDNNPLTSQWNLRYGGRNSENFTTIIKTTDGGYLSGGYSNSNYGGDKSQYSKGKNDYWIVKTDKDGKIQWEQAYGGSNDDYLNRIIQTLDGGYLLAGSSLSGIGGDKRQSNRGDRDYWVVKTDNKGNIEWDKRFGGSGYDELKKVIQLSTGEYILAGYSISPFGGDKSQGSQGGADFWLVKISKTGIKIWDKRYGGSLNDLLSGIVETADGGYLLSGTSASGKGGDKSQVSRGGSDFWIIQVDKNGKKLWDKTYGGSGQDEAFSSGRNGNEFFISGQSDSPAGADKTRGSQGGKDFWLLKLTSTGAKVWDKRYGGSKDDELKASILTKDGGYILAGKSFSDKSGNKSQNSQGSSDYWIVKTDKDGIYQWDKRFGGSGAEDLRAVTQTQDGGLLLAGKSDSGVSGDRTQPSQGGTDFWLVKVAPETTPIVAVREATFVEEPVGQIEAVTLNAYPNPFQDKVTISFTLPQTQPATLKVYDLQGRPVTTLFQGEAKANQTYQVEWQAKDKAIGLYFLQLQTPTKRQQQKILLAK